MKRNKELTKEFELSNTYIKGYEIYAKAKNNRVFFFINDSIN